MITGEKQIVRDLAKRLRELAHLPIMEEKRQLWYDHNDLKTDRPLLVCSPEAAWKEVITRKDLACEDPALREIEWILRARIARTEFIHDDVPAEAWWDCQKMIGGTGWKLDGREAVYASANAFAIVPSIGPVPPVWQKNYHFSERAADFQPLISDRDLEDPDLIERLEPPEIIYDEESSKKRLEFHQELLGDILDVHWTGANYFEFGVISVYTLLRGYENALYDLYDYPDEMHSLLNIITEHQIRRCRQLEEMELLSGNNGCQYCGSGGLGYTREIEDKPDQPTCMREMWGGANSQEFVSVSPEMSNEFAIEYETKFLKNFKFSAYGCCDNLENKLKYVLKIPNVRRISVCPWADVASMREQIGMKAVFSCKPNPSYIAQEWNEDFMRQYMTGLLTDGKGTPMELILKDTHTIGGDPSRLRKWTDLSRECIQKVYGG